MYDMEHPPFAAGYEMFVILYRCCFFLLGCAWIVLVLGLGIAVDSTGVTS